MYLFIPILVIAFLISFLLGRKMQDRIVSDTSPFSFADDILIINTGSIFSVQRSHIECIELHYNPKAVQHRFYEMKIQLVKTDGSEKSIRYKGCGSGAQPQDMEAALMAHRIKCIVKES